MVEHGVGDKLARRNDLLLREGLPSQYFFLQLYGGLSFSLLRMINKEALLNSACSCSFGDAEVDHLDILAPILQCCR